MFNRILQFFCRSRCKSRGQVKQDVQVMGGRGWASYRPSMSSESLARGIREAESLSRFATAASATTRRMRQSLPTWNVIAHAVPSDIAPM